MHRFPQARNINLYDSIGATRKGRAMPYMSDFRWNDDATITVGTITHGPKLITGSRLPAVVGADPWMSRFAVWCELTRCAARPFVKSDMYVASNVLRARQIAFLRDRASLDVITPEDVWGWNARDVRSANYFDDDIFGGMWDARLERAGEIEGAVVTRVIPEERSGDWEDGVPGTVRLMASLYAWLMGTRWWHVVLTAVDDVSRKMPRIMALDDSNTRVLHGRVTKTDVDAFRSAIEWHDRYLTDGARSPRYDWRLDGEYLDLLQEREPMPDGMRVAPTYVRYDDVGEMSTMRGVGAS